MVRGRGRGGGSSGGSPRVRFPLNKGGYKPASRPIVRSRPEGIRWLRADGTPNWSQRVRKAGGDARSIASRPAITIHKSTPIIEATEKIYKSRVRGLVVVRGGIVEGVVLATDLINYLGGGDYYQIVVSRHKDSIYSALRREVVSTIMNRSPIVVTLDESLEGVLSIMVGEGVGFLPVVYEDGSIYGVITERDVVSRLADTPFDKKVEDHMTSTIVAVDMESPIIDAMKLMVAHGFRRLPVISAKTGDLKGIITAKDLVSYFGSHEAFKAATEGKLSEVLATPVYMVMSPEVHTISPKSSVADAAKRMLEMGVDSLIVVEGGEARGIITERDILVAAAVGE
ncbi:MAG: CBS domain-containing protein [Aeropyrum sp.]|nr:CBS domain-containing protein [Aeropyrum sp.]